MEAMSRDRATLVAAYEWTSLPTPLYHSPIHIQLRLQKGGFGDLLCPKSVSHKWRIGPSSLHNFCPQIEQTASCNP